MSQAYQLGSYECKALVDGSSSNSRRSKLSSAFPQALQKTPLCAVISHCLWGEELELHHLYPLGKEVGLEIPPCPSLCHHDRGSDGYVPEVGILGAVLIITTMRGASSVLWISQEAILITGIPHKFLASRRQQCNIVRWMCNFLDILSLSPSGPWQLL